MTDAAARPPPEKMFRIPSSGLFVNRSVRACVFTFGTGTFVSARKIARIPSVKRSLRRMSGARKAVRTVSIKPRTRFRYRSRPRPSRPSPSPWTSASASVSGSSSSTATGSAGPVPARAIAARRPFALRPFVRLAAASSALASASGSTGALSGQLRRWTVDPAAVSLSSAVLLKAWAWMVTPFGASPLPRILTGSFVSRIRPSCASTSGVTSVPLSTSVSFARLSAA